MYVRRESLSIYVVKIMQLFSSSFLQFQAKVLHKDFLAAQIMCHLVIFVVHLCKKVVQRGEREREKCISFSHFVVFIFSRRKLAKPNFLFLWGQRTLCSRTYMHVLLFTISPENITEKFHLAKNIKEKNTGGCEIRKRSIK